VLVLLHPRYKQPLSWDLDLLLLLLFLQEQHSACYQIICTAQHAAAGKTLDTDTRE
jgi:hypothetical protein